MSPYIKSIEDNYTVLDLETTGLNPYKNHIIEVGLLKVRDNKIVDTYSKLIKPPYSISSFITQLTGITQSMLDDKKPFYIYEDDIISFIGNDIILGHNTNFDIRFLNSHLTYPIDNHYMDTMYLSRKVYPELSHHRLSDLVNYLHLHQNNHRAIDDCIATKELYDMIKADIERKHIKL